MEIYQSVFFKSNLPENTCRRVSSTFFFFISLIPTKVTLRSIWLFLLGTVYSQCQTLAWFPVMALYSCTQCHCKEAYRYMKEPQQHEFMLVAVQYQSKNFIPVKNLPTVSCKCRTTTHFGIKSASLWSGLDSWLFSSIQNGIAIIIGPWTRKKLLTNVAMRVTWLGGSPPLVEPTFCFSFKKFAKFF